MPKRKRGSSREQPRKSSNIGSASPKSIPRNSVQYNLLHTLYSDVKSLREYILDKLPYSSRSRRKCVVAFDTQWPAYAGFLDSTVIGILHTPSDEIRAVRDRDLLAFTQTQRSASSTKNNRGQCDVGEVVGFTIWQLFQKTSQTSRRPDHLLCHGYEKALTSFSDQRIARNMILPGIFEQWPNHNVEYLNKSPWLEVFSLLGHDFESILSCLLFDCGIFVALESGKDNLFQLSGQPVFNIHQARPSYLALCDSARTNFNPPRTCRKPGQIIFVRSRIFYARASVSRNGLVKLGLKHIHVFNRSEKWAARVQHLRYMQYMFPLQFGLHNVFVSRVNPTETSQPWKDYTVRDEEITQYNKKFGEKMPKRLRDGVSRLIHKIMVNHHRCSYVQMLYHYTQGKQLMQTAAEHQRVSADLAETGCGTDEAVTTTSWESRPDTSFIPHATSQSNVSAFCRAVLQRLLPANTFGTGMEGASNWSQLLAMVNRFVIARRFESFSLHEVVYYMKIASIDWLRPAKACQGDKLSMSDRTKRLELLYEFVYFLFDSMLVHLIRSNFYVTETAMHRNRLFYFRHDVWKKISEPSLTVLRLNMFESLNAHHFRHTMQHNKLGYSQMRLLPKEHGARPITNLRRRAMVVINGKRTLGTSTNSKLAPTFSILNFERHRRPESIASALFSVGEIGQRLKNFSGLQMQQDPSTPRLFFVKMDIKSCFDTIPQEQLLTLIHTILKEEEYRITKHAESKRLANPNKDNEVHLRSKFVSRASGQAFEPAFPIDQAKRLGDRKRRTIFTGTDHHRIIRLSQIHQLLKDHIRDNIVRIGRRHFRQVKGIPQGSIISSLLCSFFYANFEHEKLNFLDAQSSILLRLIDDFLLVTTNREQAHLFVNAMSEGFGQYGISINAEKSLVNFEASVQGHKIPRIHGTEYFPYCGLGIHMKSLELNKDRQRKDGHVENALTIDISGRATTSLQRRILTALTIQMHAMLLDTSHNSPMQIMITLFGCYVEATMKMHQYRTHMPRSKRPGAKFMIALCQQMLVLGQRLLTSLPSNNHQSTQKIQVHQVGSLAMTKVLSRKQTEYKHVLRWLDGIQSYMHHRNSGERKGLDRIVREGLAPFQYYIY